jgi:hypothetical protein
MYIKGEDNCVTNALSHRPVSLSSTEAEIVTKHPYQYYDEDCEDNVACIWPCTVQNPWETASVLSSQPMTLCSVNATLHVTADKELLETIRQGYEEDAWCKHLPMAVHSFPNLKCEHGLWYMGDQLIIPHVKKSMKFCFNSHDVLGHFSFDKTYGSLHSAYYWPNMQRDLENGYVASCPECQCNKSVITKPYGPLHPLPVPDKCGDSVAIDFIGLLPEDD